MNKIRHIVLVLVAFAILVLPTLAWSMEIATVNGKNLTDKDMEQSLNGFNESQRHSLLKDYNSRLQIINGLIDQTLLSQEAQKERLDQDSEYKQALENFKQQYLASRVIQKSLYGKLTDSAAKRFYEANKWRYSTDQVHAMHILVEDEDTAQKLLKMAQAPGADFQALAEKYSKDPSAKNNRGDLGFITHDQLVREFSDAAFGAKDGEIIGPVKTPFGYHVIKIVEHKVGTIPELSDVQSRVMGDLQTELTRKYLDNLRKTAKISVNDKALHKM